MKKNNVVLIDFLPIAKWSFLEKLTFVSSEQWKSLSCQTNQYHGTKLSSLKRMFWYFMFPLQIVLKRKKFGKIIAWQQFYGLNFAFWSRLFHLKKINDLTVMTFIYKRKSGGAGFLYHQYMKFIVTSKYIDRFICFAKEECDYYSEMFGVNKRKFVFVPLGKAEVTDISITDGGYVFATGRSNRDYNFLTDTFCLTNHPLIIACDTYYPTSNWKNIEVLNECHGNQMLELMAKCHCVVCPLKNLKTSSGQLVVIQAMALGKPVICTKADGIKDYVEDGITGILVDNNKKAWFEALSKMYEDMEFYNKMCINAKASYHENFTENAMFERIAKLINQK